MGTRVPIMNSKSSTNALLNLEENSMRYSSPNNEALILSRRSSLTNFYRIERTQIAEDTLVSLSCFFFTFFIFFIKIADCSEENCLDNDEDPWNWTLQSLIALGGVNLLCLIL